MTAVLLLDAGRPLLQQFFPSLPLIEQVQNTPLLIAAVLMCCLGAAYLALWRAVPDFRAFRSMGIFFSIAAVCELFNYLGGHTPYVSLRAIATGVLEHFSSRCTL